MRLDSEQQQLIPKLIGDPDGCPLTEIDDRDKKRGGEGKGRKGKKGMNRWSPDRCLVDWLELLAEWPDLMGS